MKKILTLLSIFAVAIMASGCTKQIVFTNRTLDQTKLSFDNYIKTTGYNYKIKDDVNNIYNVHVYQYNLEYLLQSKPMISQDYGFTCKFKALNNGKDTLVDCNTYPIGSNAGFDNITRYLKEQKFDDMKYISYKKYKQQQLNAKNQL